MGTEVTQSAISKVLDWAYEKAVEGVPGLDSAQELAASYAKGGGSVIDQANSLIRWQNTKAGASGLLSGLGGILTLPVTIPANVASVMYVQIRMIAAIARLGGHDLKDDRVKALVYACLTGNAIKDVLKDVGIVVGRKLAENAIKGISGKTLVQINRAVGFRLLTKAGEKGVVNLGKSVPILGGLIGMTFDAVTTNTVGNVARDTFLVDLPAQTLRARTTTTSAKKRVATKKRVAAKRAGVANEAIGKAVTKVPGGTAAAKKKTSAASKGSVAKKTAPTKRAVKKTAAKKKLPTTPVPRI